MPDYRRHRVAGGCYFFTVNLHDRRSALLVEKIAVLRDSVRAARARHPFHIDAFKAHFSRSFGPAADRRTSLVRKRESGIWQRRCWEHTIRTDEDYAAHMDYVHFNPVKHGLAAHPAAWPWSSFRRCVARGMYPADWAAGADLAEAGERP